MSDPAEAIQRAVVARLAAVAAVTDLVGPRIYDRVPPGAAFPYLTIGLGDGLDAATQCHELTETFLEVHVWSRAVGKVEAKRIAAAVRQALFPGPGLPSPLTLSGHGIATSSWRSTRYLSDRDGQTTHAIVTGRLITGPT